MMPWHRLMPSIIRGPVVVTSRQVRKSCGALPATFHIRSFPPRQIHLFSTKPWGVTDTNLPNPHTPEERKKNPPAALCPTYNNPRNPRHHVCLSHLFLVPTDTQQIGLCPTCVFTRRDLCSTRKGTRCPAFTSLPPVLPSFFFFFCQTATAVGTGSSRSMVFWLRRFFLRYIMLHLVQRWKFSSWP